MLLLITIADFHNICQDPGSQDLAKGIWALLLVSGSQTISLCSPSTCVRGSTKRPPSIRVLGYLYPGQMWLFQRMLLFSWNNGWVWLLVPPTPLPATPVSSNRVDSWSWSLVQTSLLPLAGAISWLPLLQPESLQRRRDQKKRMEREKEVSFPQKQFNKNQQSTRILYFSILLNKMFWIFL